MKANDSGSSTGKLTEGTCPPQWGAVLFSIWTVPFIKYPSWKREGAVRREELGPNHCPWQGEGAGVTRPSCEYSPF